MTNQVEIYLGAGSQVAEGAEHAVVVDGLPTMCRGIETSAHVGEATRVTMYMIGYHLKCNLEAEVTRRIEGGLLPDLATREAQMRRYLWLKDYAHPAEA